MTSHGAILVLIQVAKGLGTVYALLGLAAFLHFFGDFKYSPPRVRDKNVFVDELRLSLNEPMVGKETNMTWMETVSWSPLRSHRPQLSHGRRVQPFDRPAQRQRDPVESNLSRRHKWAR